MLPHIAVRHPSQTQEPLPVFFLLAAGALVEELLRQKPHSRTLALPQLAALVVHVRDGAWQCDGQWNPLQCTLRHREAGRALELSVWWACQRSMPNALSAAR